MQTEFGWNHRILNIFTFQQVQQMNPLPKTVRTRFLEMVTKLWLNRSMRTLKQWDSCLPQVSGLDPDLDPAISSQCHPDTTSWSTPLKTNNLLQTSISLLLLKVCPLVPTNPIPVISCPWPRNIVNLDLQQATISQIIFPDMTIHQALTSTGQTSTHQASMLEWQEKILNSLRPAQHRASVLQAGVLVLLLLECCMSTQEAPVRLWHFRVWTVSVIMLAKIMSFSQIKTCRTFKSTFLLACRNWPNHTRPVWI